MVTTALFMLLSFWIPPPQPWKAAKGKATKAVAKAKAKGKAKAKCKAEGKPRHRSGKPKLASWLTARPHGCAKCRYCPGCTKSCYVIRGEAVPK